MTTHIMKLQPEPFEAIKQETKVIESRLYDRKRREIKLGDIIEFQKNPDLTEKIEAKVIGLLNYPTFNDLFSDFPSAYFGRDTKEALLSEIHKFYSEEDEQKYSVLGIKIHLL